jgi:CPA1 family monovalent cation:H+ antiporter
LALVITGLIIGAPQLVPHAHLEPHTLFTVFLPPLLFESAINLRAELLRRNWQPISLYAVFGTLISTVLVGGLSAWLLKLPLPVALVFGALVSPTDPISVIAVFKRLGVGKRLSVLVEAESLFNDGVAVVLFSLLIEMAMGGRLTVAYGLQQFVVTVLGGAAVGAGIGGVASRLTRHFDDHLLEITLTTIVAFGSYLGAEALHVSGVIAVVVGGLVVGSYGMPTGMSATTRLAVSSFWEYAAFAANSIVFLLVGIDFTIVNLGPKLGMAAGAVGILLAGRAAAIYLLSPLVNRLGGDVPLAWQHVLFWGGLRGALPMALVLGLREDFPHRETLVALTFSVVLFSLLAQGLTVEALLKRLGLTGTGKRESAYQRLVSEILACRAAIRELERLEEERSVSARVCTPLAQEYRQRIDELEHGVEELHLSNEDLWEEQSTEARRLALLAEKSALQETHRNGLLDEEELRHLVEGIDTQLARLHAGGGH